VFFTPPPTTETSVFASLPDNLRMHGEPSEWRDGQPGSQPVHSLLEGPAFDRDGNLWCVDIAYGRIFRLRPNHGFEVMIAYDGEPNGLAFHQDGRLFIADYRNGVMVFDPRTGNIAPFLQRHHLERLKAVNDLTFADNGDLYFTDQGMTGLHDPTGRVFRVRPGCAPEMILSNVPSPNGLVLSPDGATLYVAATRGNSIWRVPMMPDGSVAKVGNFIQLSGGQGPDGLAIDRDGGLVICHIGLGTVWHMTPRGEPARRFVSPTGLHTTNVAFGGENRDQLFITEAETGTVLSAQTDTRGLPLFGGY